MKRWKKITIGTLTTLLLAAAVFVVPTLWFKPWSINHFYARTFMHFMLSHPMMLSGMRILEPMGIESHNSKLDDNTIEFQMEEMAWLDKQLEILRSYDRSGLDDQLSYDVLEWFLDDMQQMNKFAFHDYPVNQSFGIQSGLPDFMINTHQILDARGAGDYVERLNRFDEFLGQVADGLRYRAERGVVPPMFVLDRVRIEMNDFIASDPAEHPLYEHFESKTAELENLEALDREKLLKEAEEAITNAVYPGYRSLIAEIDALAVDATTDDGVWKLPNGDDYYAMLLRHHTTTDMTSDEVHALGLQEVEKIRSEMIEILTSEGYTVDQLGATVQALSKEERFSQKNTEEGRQAVLDGYQEIVDEIANGLDDVFDIRPRAGVTVKRVPEFKQETATTAYYDAPPFDASRSGVFWVNLRNVEEHYSWGMRTLAYHEAIPGHHFQIALAMEMEGTPFFRRVIPFTAYIEGWALYAERVAAEIGFQDDPYNRLGYLQAQMFRAVRLVIDTGIHTRRWTREQAIEYMLANTGMPESDVISEIERYIVTPGQACAYKVGQLAILKMREEARSKLGEKFDIRGFHNVVLSNGALPLTLLEQEVKAWVNRSQQGG